MNRFKNRLAALGFFLALIAFAPTASSAQETVKKGAPREEAFFQNFLDVPFGGELVAQTGLYTVPAGKRLVIEHFSNAAFLAVGESPVRFALLLLRSDLTVYGRHALPVPAGAADGETVVFSFGQPLRLYVEAGNKVSCEAVRNTSALSGSSYQCSFSGYLVDAQ